MAGHSQLRHRRSKSTHDSASQGLATHSEGSFDAAFLAPARKRLSAAYTACSTLGNVTLDSVRLLVQGAHW